MTRIAKLWMALAVSGSLAGCVEVDGHDAPAARPAGYSVRELGAVPAMARGDVADPGAQAVAFARSRLAAGPLDDYRVRPEAADLSRVRLDHYYDGVRVWGSDVVVQGDAEAIRGVSGTLVVPEGVDTRPARSWESALADAEADYAGLAGPGAALAYAREAHELVVYPTGDGGARLAWHISFFTEQQAGLDPGRWEYFIDAHDGTSIDHWNAIDSAAYVMASGMAPASLALTASSAPLPNQWVNQLPAQLLNGKYTLSTGLVETRDSHHGTTSGTVVSQAVLNDAIANNAHGNAAVVESMLREWFGYNSLDDKGMRIVSRVHYGVNVENAYWDGAQMIYGDGGANLYPPANWIDVSAHEIVHAFTDKHSNLVKTGQSGAVAESFADIGGATVQFYFAPDTATFDIGCGMIKGTDICIRYLCDPHQDGNSIDNAAEYHNGLDVHYASGVVNKAFCRAAKRLSSGSPEGVASATGVRRAAQAWFVANDDKWASSVTYVSACQGVVDAARLLGYSTADVAAIGDSFRDVGVTCNY